jgi:hypothetical protein
MNLLETYKSEIDKLCEMYNVESLFSLDNIEPNIFTNNSDLELIVKFKEMDLMGYANNYFDFKFKLQDLLNLEISLIEYHAIKSPYYKETVDQHKHLVYG